MTLAWPALWTIKDAAWVYSPKLAACDIAPHFKNPDRCSICGIALSERGDNTGFCGDDCARLFFVNHNWDLARRAAAYHADYTCQRCGHHVDTITDPLAHTRELVVRHRRPPESGNRRSRGCHQHLENLITLCRSCDTTPARPALQFAQDHHAVTNTSDDHPFEDAPTSTVNPEELAAGPCHPSQGRDPEFWFRQRQSAIKLCQQCPVRARCARHALELKVTDGVWAGISLPGKRKPHELNAARGRLQQLLIDSGASAPLADRPTTPPRLERVGA